ncbi:conjugative transposon protein TraN [Pedobacter sp. WC2423]|uniref:conjugative transposon protein TraN n=1 Tax=Pedobacter sp. WC2423 TaxID=3234142 RepID=UPI00346676A9
MKKISVGVIVGLFSLLLHFSVFAQVAATEVLNMQPNYVAVNENMAVNLIFPFPVKRAQWVSTAITVQQFKGVDNILLLKANKKDFPLTNVSVVTTDGQFYSFVIGYSNELSVINHKYQVKEKPLVTFSEENSLNEASVQKNSEKVSMSKSESIRIKERKYGLQFGLDGIFVNGNLMYYKLHIKNRTNVQYDIDQLRFFVRDEKKSKRTAIQEQEMMPLYINNSNKTIKGNAEQNYVYVIKKLTIPDKKYLTIQLMEKGGGRHLELNIANNKIIQAKSL